MKKSVSKSRTQVAMHPKAEVTKVQLQSFKQLHDIFCEEKAKEGDIFDGKHIPTHPLLIRLCFLFSKIHYFSDMLFC